MNKPKARWTGMALLSLFGALFSLVLASMTQIQAWNWLAVTLGLLGFVTVFTALYKSMDRSQHNPGYFIRLVFFALVAIMLVGVVFSAVLARSRVRAMVYPSRNQSYVLPEEYGILNYKEIEFETEDGLRLEGWYMPPENGALVILIHGHGGNRSQLLPDAAVLVQAGFGALVYDARNHGGSQGEITTFGMLEARDVHAALSYLNEQPEMNDERIGLLGHSMGGATAIVAGAEIPQVRAVMTQSTYASMEDNLRGNLDNLLGLPPFPFLPMVIFWGEREIGLEIQLARPVDSVAQISPRALMIVHGAQDPVLPVENAHRLYEAAREPKELYILPEAGHCCLLEEGGNEYAERIVEFFRDSLLNDLE